MKPDKILSLVGLATRAGKTASGEFCTEKEVKTGRAALVIVAGDASENTKKKFRDMCEFYEVPIYFYKDKDTWACNGKGIPGHLLQYWTKVLAKEITKQMKTEDNTVA